MSYLLMLILSVQLSSVEGLASYTLPRFWPKDASSLIGSIHIRLVPLPALSPGQEPTFCYVDHVVERVDALLRDRISGLEELTIQVEERAPSGRYID